MLNLTSHLALPGFVLSIIVLALRGNLISSMPVVALGQLFGLALMIWARAIFPKGSFRVTAKPAGSTVLRKGPYRLIRHPMYAGAMLILWTSIAGHASTVNAAIGLSASALVLGKILFEEQLLKVSLPGYPEYARATKALIPYIF